MSFHRHKKTIPFQKPKHLPGERGTAPKAGNHSPVKFLDLSSDFRPPAPEGYPPPGSPELTRPAPARPESLPRPTAQHTGTMPLNFHPAPAPTGEPLPGSTGTHSARPESLPRPTAQHTGTIPAQFHRPRLPQGNHRPAHRNSLRPAESLPRPTARLHRNHPGSFSTRPTAPRRAPAARLTGTYPSRLPPARISPETHRPAPPEPSRLIFHPAPAPTGGTTTRLHRNSLAPAPARPRLPERHPPPGTPELIRPSSRRAVPLPRPAAQLHRNHPGSFSTRPPAPRRATAARLHRNLPVPAPAQPESSPRPTAQRRRNHPGSTSTRRSSHRRTAARHTELPRPVSAPARVPLETRGPHTRTIPA